MGIGKKIKQTAAEYNIFFALKIHINILMRNHLFVKC